MKKLLKKTISFILVLSFLIFPSSFVNASSLSDFYNEYYCNLFEQIVDIYLKDHLYEISREELIDKMIHNLIAENPETFPYIVNTLLKVQDPYSGYYTSDSSFLKTVSKSYGFIISQEEHTENTSGGIYINDIIKGSNAEIAGFLANDRIISVEGISLEGLTIFGTAAILSALPLKPKEGNPSSMPNPDTVTEDDDIDWDPRYELTFVVERKNETTGKNERISINIPKGYANTKDVFLTLLDDINTGYIEISSFTSDTIIEDFTSALDYLIDNGYKNIIFNLRDNSGGYTDYALSMADLFVKENTCMGYTVSRNESMNKKILATENYIGDKFDKLVVLTNEDTISAAELFTNILKSCSGAATIGETTYGKGIGQVVYTLPDDSMLAITSYEILSPDKSNYNGIGLVPDIEVPIVKEKFDFPKNLEIFNHNNYTNIVPGAKNSETLALEQRLEILGFLRHEYVDGIYDENTTSAVMAFQYVYINSNKEASGVLSYDEVTVITTLINGYKDRYFDIDSQTEVAKMYIKNNSQAKRLAKEYIIEQQRVEKEIADKEKENAENLENVS